MASLKTNLGGFNVKLVGVQVLEEKSEMIQKSLRFQSVNHPDKMLKSMLTQKLARLRFINRMK